MRYAKSARLLRPGGWLALVGNDDRYDEPFESALAGRWIARTDTGGAWEKPPSDPEVIAATELFGAPVLHDHTARLVRPAADVIDVESTRATFLSWPADARQEFTAELRERLRSQPEVHLTRHTSVTMMPVLQQAG